TAMKCDLKVDCSDKSDESFEQCYQMECPFHQCSYGACYGENQYCDGKQDCWDGTDEYQFNCATNEETDKLYANKIRGNCL
ncbi:hypothetical protein KR044_009419, partial [Drosophila immigrans]